MLAKEDLFVIHSFLMSATPPNFPLLSQTFEMKASVDKRIIDLENNVILKELEIIELLTQQNRLLFFANGKQSEADCATQHLAAVRKKHIVLTTGSTTVLAITTFYLVTLDHLNRRGILALSRSERLIAGSALAASLGFCAGVQVWGIQAIMRDIQSIHLASEKIEEYLSYHKKLSELITPLKCDFKEATSLLDQLVSESNSLAEECNRIIHDL